MQYKQAKIYLKNQVTIVIGFCRKDNLDQTKRQGRQEKVNWKWLFIGLYLLHSVVCESTDYVMLNVGENCI
jgi:hypothetical protein